MEHSDDPILIIANGKILDVNTAFLSKFENKISITNNPKIIQNKATNKVKTAVYKIFNINKKEET